MDNVWLYTILSVIVVSLISFFGVLFLALSLDRLKKVLLYLVSFSAGALLGGAFIHLLPELVEEGNFSLNASLYILLGMIVFFSLEKIICWRHCHIPTSDDHPHPFAYMNLVGDAFHNFVDGLIIAGSYLVSIPLGVSTTIAVIFHEIPQEIGDFGVLIHGGFSKGRALLMNFLSASTAILGAIAALVIGSYVENLTQFLIPFTIGGFIYIAASDLIPELKKDIKPMSSVIQLIFLLVGMGVMLLLLH